ncbi:glycoside hydrolase family 2 TIM barrel-domain containing protein [Sphingobacterium oryzagri]|uniref:Glycoside hydrolase family 2 TIM barrel-domain containing protein n=1 Tax=Sphingobacterium oryzagri TaxID=3025669 RepID=A0ABY7WHJ8_9SPHI|nr:glycoside hydrolase family 2 TIM barrel-domain containing protein [Sphingobacterium sp. KACC 22765]WDF69093.1 glycoside hydrolase family 2 TIM barrel-domain containing protein [Sphingobacterium sp. KACC 22765]
MTRFFFVLLSLLLSSGLFAQSNRQENFNSDWRFLQADELQFRHVHVDDKQWKAVTLPHDWSILSDFGAEFPAGNAGGALPGGIAWYRKTFPIATADKGKHITIHFDGAYRYTEVWINGHYLGKHSNGYLSFSHELSSYLHYGGKPNVLAVRVDNSQQPNSRWYSGSGIYRDVVLSYKDVTHFIPEEVFVSTPLVSKDEGTVRVRASIANPANQKLTAAFSLIDDKGKVVAESKEKMQDAAIDAIFSVNNPKLWDVSSPNLYRLQMTLLTAQGKVLNRFEQRIGFRSIAFDVHKGFFLNGQQLKLKGVCLHHDLGALGAVFNKSAAKRQLLIMKDMGANAIRTAHNPPAPALLDLCDELGILVYNEAYDMWQKRKNKFDYHVDFKEHHVADLQAFVKRDRNHPAVIMWSIGNEIREQFDSTGTVLTKEMTAVVKALDDTRPVTAALTETNYEKNFIAQAEALDVLGFNYKFEDYDKLPKEFKGVPLIASETTSGLQTRGVYDALHDTIQFWPASSKDKFVTNGNPDFSVSAYDNVAAYWGTSHERAWLEVKKREFLGGIFVWTGFDYLGEPVPYPYPARSSYYGIVDLAGFPKDVYYMYQSEWTEKEVLHLLPHWNWKAGEMVDVWAYYNQADEVELFLNGKSLGKSQKTAERLHATWQVAFAPGELKVVKYRDGKAVQEQIRYTAGAASQLKAEVTHDDFVTGDKTDLYFVEVQLQDVDGHAVQHDDIELTFLSADNATIVGTDNGFQADLRSLSSPQRKTFKGKALAIVRLQDQTRAGSIRVKSKLGELTVSLLPKKTE